MLDLLLPFLFPFSLRFTQDTDQEFRIVGHLQNLWHDTAYNLKKRKRAQRKQMVFLNLNSVAFSFLEWLETNGKCSIFCKEILWSLRYTPFDSSLVCLLYILVKIKVLIHIGFVIPGAKDRY